MATRKIKNLAKKYLPKYFYNSAFIVLIFFKELEFYASLILSYYFQKKTINRLKSRKKLKVAFIYLLESNWKCDSVYKAFERHFRFDPVVVICPFFSDGMERCFSEIENAKKLCVKNGYSYYNTFDDKRNIWLDFKSEIKPDIVFFSTPHNHSKKEYQIKYFLDTLTCYIPYSIRTDHLVDLQFNGYFHNLVWLNLYETETHRKMAERFARNRGFNVEIVGYPTIDLLAEETEEKNKYYKTIIWAPHWTIPKTDLNRSCFLTYYDFFLSLPVIMKNRVRVVFRPHPLLKSTLYRTQGWGRTRTDEYYNKWSNTEGLSISTGEYIDIFKKSDVLVHDSVSFLAEYLATGKPAIFTKREQDIDPDFNEFGKICLSAHYIVRSVPELQARLEDMLFKRNLDSKRKLRQSILTRHMNIGGRTAAENIVQAISSRLS